MVVDAASAKAEFGSSLHEVLEIRDSIVIGVGKKKLPIENLWEQLIEINADELTSHGDGVRTVDPAQVFDEVEIILGLVLIGRRSWTELESGGQECELVDAAGEIVGRAIDAGVAGRYGIDVNSTIVDVNQAKT